MYSLRLQCSPEQAEQAVADLWEAETLGISETDEAASVILLAGFSSDTNRDALLQHFAGYTPEWQHDDRDWFAQVRQSWPPREVGQRLYLAPAWNESPTPPGRLRIVHNPSMASGTGEHPCTRLALMALEDTVSPSTRLLDVGTGSGLLCAAAVQLGAAAAFGIDLDAAALGVAQENLSLNHAPHNLVCGSIDCVRDESASVTVANISGSVLMEILSDLIRVTTSAGQLILTGFSIEELPAFWRIFPNGIRSELEGWACLRTYV